MFEDFDENNFLKLDLFSAGRVESNFIKSEVEADNLKYDESNLSWDFKHNLNKFILLKTDYSVLNITINVEKNCNLKIFTYHESTTDFKVNINLIGSDSSCELINIFILGSACSIKYNLLVNHSADYTSSKVLSKHILTNYSHLEFEGILNIAEAVQYADSDMQSNTLLLSPNAQVISKPGLKIASKNIKSVHGNTISGPNEDLLLYLKSRGLSESEAIKFIKNSFVAESFNLLKPT